MASIKQASKASNLTSEHPPMTATCSLFHSSRCPPQQQFFASGKKEEEGGTTAAYYSCIKRINLCQWYSSWAMWETAIDAFDPIRHFLPILSRYHLIVIAPVFVNQVHHLLLVADSDEDYRSAAIAASLLMPRQHSPISRFLSSLSHHCTSPVSSSNNSRRSSYMDEVNTGDITEDRAIGEGINNYGIISKQSLGKLRNNLKYVDSAMVMD